MAVTVVAFLVRLLPVLRGGGLGFFGRYDDGVYYTAAEALTFGRVPYRDFLLLHPPGIVLILMPFALLGRMTSDPVGFSVARVVFMAIGAANAGLVTALAGRWGRGAAITAGLLYACWFPAVYDEQTTLLEPVGGGAVLVALLIMTRRGPRPTSRRTLIAGVVLGLATGVKIWYVAPFAAVVIWQLALRRGRSATHLLLGGMLSLTAVVLPFAILARSAMFTMVVRDQLSRPAGGSRFHRLTSIFGVRQFSAGQHASTTVLIIIIALLALAACVVAIREPSARILVGVLGVDLVVLGASPSYFQHYAALTAAPAALVVGVAMGHLGRGRWTRNPLRIAAACLVLIIVASGARLATSAEGRHFPAHTLAKADPSGCVISDDPTALILMNRLTTDFDQGCGLDVDVTGLTYASLKRLGPEGQTISRKKNRAWQTYLHDYLLSGRSFILIREHGDGLSRQQLHDLQTQPVLARAGSVTLHAS